MEKRSKIQALNLVEKKFDQTATTGDSQNVAALTKELIQCIELAYRYCEIKFPDVSNVRDLIFFKEAILMDQSALSGIEKFVRTMAVNLAYSRIKGRTPRLKRAEIADLIGLKYHTVANATSNRQRDLAEDDYGLDWHDFEAWATNEANQITEQATA